MGKILSAALTALVVSAVFVSYFAGLLFDTYFRLVEMSIFGE